MITQRPSITNDRCDSCDAGDEAKIIVLTVGVELHNSRVVRLCDLCVDTELVPALSWTIR